jgi:hypothetical protein
MDGSIKASTGREPNTSRLKGVAFMHRLSAMAAEFGKVGHFLKGPRCRHTVRLLQERQFRMRRRGQQAFVSA